jgi:cell wall-associated NlpC family hydrolase
VVTALAMSVTTVVLPSEAGASPQTELSAKRAEAERLAAQIDAAQERAQVVNEQYLQAKAAADDAEAKIAGATAAIKMAEERAAKLSRQVGSRAARLYMGVGMNDPLGLDVESVRELGSRAKYSQAAAAHDEQVVDDLVVAQEDLAHEREALKQVENEARDRQAAADDALGELRAATDAAESSLSSVKGDIADLVADIERERQAAEEAAARAAQAQREAQERAARPAASDNGGGGGGGGGPAPSSDPTDIGVDPGSVPAPSPGAAAAIAFARAQVGKPYIYAGVGPEGFDCSGLTMMAWAQGGVSMSHGSQDQYNAFPKVPISQLQPGDLVFFGSSGPSNHHGALYIGGGTMIEAPHTGAFVRYSTIYRRDLVPLGSRPG